MDKKDEALLERFGEHPTPFYYYDGDALHAHVSSLLSRLHPAVRVHYALKANGNVALAGLLRSLGCGVEIASAGEMFVAMEAGYAAEDVLYAGPGKTVAELNEAIAYGIGCIHVESVSELRLLEDIAAQAGQLVRAAVRINPDNDLSGATIKMGGVPRPFGVDEGQLDHFFKVLEDCPHVHFQGIQVYTGTQMLKSDQILASFANTLQLAERVQAQYGVAMHTVNLGGGFGVPYFAHEQPLDMDHVIDGLNALAEQTRTRMPGVKLIIESGRYLVAQSGMYVCRALYTKESKGEKFVVADGGMNHYAAATFRGRRIRDNYPVRIMRKQAGESKEPKEREVEATLRKVQRDASAQTAVAVEQSLEEVASRIGEPPEEASLELETVSIVGPLCTPEDCIVKKAQLPPIHEGDYIAFPNAGAYGLSYSPLQFLGHATPAELLDFRGEVHVIREHGDRTDLLHHQRMIPLPEDAL
ncbi:alanine racemase [Paenibacillus polymyxa]|uniref:alanine racemase n=1 Tax=Paenibacillus polymyxa TaxID=1406 RepID=UPI002AB56304|nr:alanine racemase [Paenibacillus polymyxa]MDY7991763.1 alanine racemase [Paenibacillus polymyxa]MDY8118388.1 alanine racemase [Paenibacillus polymyxa]